MEEKPLVSVIVPLYNQGGYVKETIESVLNQSYSNWELIVVDDGSTDAGGEIVESYKKNESRIIYIKQLNSGPSVARNNGISQSKGKYILPLDGDDKLGNEYLEKAVDYLENNADCKLVYCRAEKFGEEKGLWLLPDYSFEGLLWNNLIFCSAVFRRSDYDETDGYNPNMKSGLEDWDFWLSLLSPKDNVYRIDDVLFYYRIKNVSRNTELTDKFSDAVRQIYKNHPELYVEHVENVISIHNCLCEKNREINNLVHSNSYRVGRIITSPIRLLKWLFTCGV